ncbi:thiamine phosphate synthase [Silvibacterium dinghuense]|uniref:Thiamine-phosphate synthase n=1 Tax=Silvibacterium dinghuense TaxID=1560006 RepID=A0A4Q1SD81_9BACT|nr:thiamine phosphate synthase [Silvibacterium dinghuense]RXS95053.1 thiamine phosphate synthase [Silvibacterium dinghuense]GGH10192.1 thiamine-phosphate synthase [Silvibacterium dinghuense]
MTRTDFPRLYPILDASFLPVERQAREAMLSSLVTGLADAGVGILQYRNKTGDMAALAADARVMLSAPHGAMQLILNDHPELVNELGFDGVHVGQTDASPAEARERIGPARILGISTHNDAQLRAASTAPVDYVAIGPVYATSSKANPDPVVGLEGVRLARALTEKPIVAIGGIGREQAREVFTAGADSIAVISAVFPQHAGTDAQRVESAIQRARAFLAFCG